MISKLRLLALGGVFISHFALSQTMVPKLDQEGRKGDVARIAKQKAVDRFNGIDKDKDGRLSPDEVAQDASYLAEKFPERDINHDGYLSWEEYLGHSRWER